MNDRLSDGRWAGENSGEVSVTTWLWIIGLAALAWPVIVACYFERESNKVIQINFKRYGQLHECLEKQTAAKISDLQKLIEQQDALIAALWQKSFGFRGGEERHDSAELSEYLGLKPQWSAHRGEWAGPVDYLVRHEPYPWGTQAEELHFPE